MTASSAETAELSLRPPAVGAGVAADLVPQAGEWVQLQVVPAGPSAPPTPRGRLERRAERLRARRERMVWAGAGLSFLLLVFVAAVVVLSVLH
jgi:hypothetical protein